MQLSELLKNWPCEVKGSIRVEVEGITEQLHDIRSNELVVLRKGKRYNPFLQLDHVIAQGAAAIVVEDEQFFDQKKLDIPIIWVPNILSFMAYASHILNGKPSELLKVIAVTGTNGKTTVTHFIAQLLMYMQKKVMLIGTNGVFVNGQPFDDIAVEPLTTIGPIQLHKLLRKAVEKEVTYVVLEASSIGLAKHRLDYCEIDIGVFLNLTQDHLDVHGSMEAYKLAKQRLAVLAKTLVFNRDDPFCRAVSIVCRKRKAEFSLKEKATIHFQALQQFDDVTFGVIQIGDDFEVVGLPFIFPHELENVLAAYTVMYMLDFKLDKLVVEGKQLKLPTGRLERFRLVKGTDVYVDYAHSPGAFIAVLQPVKKLKQYERVIVVFGCGGERDQLKRTEMGRIASKFADKIYLTADNSRGESLESINRQIKKGFFATQRYVEIADREEAIIKALDEAGENDAVFILGKGHETSQAIGGQVIPFSDQAVVKRYMEKG